MSTTTVHEGDRWRTHDAFDATADLDPNPFHVEILPDGSRRVDAEALRLVCLHVAGLA